MSNKLLLPAAVMDTGRLGMRLAKGSSAVNVRVMTLTPSAVARPGVAISVEVNGLAAPGTKVTPPYNEVPGSAIVSVLGSATVLTRDVV